MAVARGFGLVRLSVGLVALASSAAALAQPAAPSPRDAEVLRLERSARRLRIGGAITLGIGGALQVSGAGLVSYGMTGVCGHADCGETAATQDALWTGIPFLVGGTALALAGAITMGVASSRHHQAI